MTRTASASNTQFRLPLMELGAWRAAGTILGKHLSVGGLRDGINRSRGAVRRLDCQRRNRWLERSERAGAVRRLDCQRRNRWLERSERAGAGRRLDCQRRNRWLERSERAGAGRRLGRPRRRWWLDCDDWSRRQCDDHARGWRVRFRGQGHLDCRSRRRRRAKH